MLTLTDTAADVVKQILEQNATADEAGLRISQDGDTDAFGLAPVESPEPGDQVLDDDGARVFLDEQAAISLDDKVLDAQVDADGSVQFAVGLQD